MPEFEIRLLGSFQITQNEKPVASPRRKTRALLAYLAASEGPYSRSALSDLFCQNTQSPSRTLSVLLSRIRKHLSPDALHSEGNRISLDEEGVWVDYTRFQTVLAADLARQAETTLESAVALYRGELLAGLTLPDAPEFELWLLGERARARHLYEEGLLYLIGRRAARGENREAIAAAQQLLQSNPLLEPAHAHLVRLYAQGGQRAAALAQYERCRNLLQQELAVEPTPDLQRLYADVRAGRIGARAEIEEKTAVSVPDSPLLPKLVGREKELGRLHAAWQAAQTAPVPPLLIEGSAGSGKTRLVEAFAARLADVAFLSGRCYESTHSTPYAPWVHLLECCLAEDRVGYVDALPEPWQAELARLLPSLAARYPVAGAGDQGQLFNAISEFLLGSEAPLILFIDDLQWADAASLALFHFLAQRLAQAPNAPVLLLGAIRSEERQENEALLTLLYDLRRGVGVAQLVIPPLPATAVSQLIVAHWPDLSAVAPLPQLRDKLLQATGGNPLFLIEICRELAEAEMAPNTLPVPPSLRELVERRLGRLPASGRQVIEALAVLDHPGSFPLLQQISARSDEETVTALEAGLGWRLLEVTGVERDSFPAYDFRHDLLRQAVLRQLSRMRRRLLHGRAARVLETEGTDAAALAFHWRMAGDEAKEVHYAALAGKAAAGLYAHTEAIRYLEAAAERLTDAERRMDVWGELGNVYIITGRWEEAEATLRRGLALATAKGNRARQGRFQGALGQLMSRRGRYDQALSYLQEALAAAEALDDTARLARYVGTIGIVHYMRDELEEALACYREALSLQQEMGDEAAAVIWQTNIAGVYNQMGCYDEALIAYREALAVDQALGAARNVAITLGNIGNVYHRMGEFGQAFHYFFRALWSRHELGDKAGVAVVWEALGNNYRVVGALARAEACYFAALGLNVELGREEGAATCLGELGLVALRRGEGKTAVRRLTESISRLRQLGVRHHLGQQLLALGEAHAAAARWEAAEASLGQARELLEEEDAAFQAEVWWARARFHLEANASLMALLPAAKTERQRAWVWRALVEEGKTTGSSLEERATELAQLYRRLHQLSPRAAYRRGYVALTGETLPAPEVPPLPDLIEQYRPPQRDALLHRLIA